MYSCCMKRDIAIFTIVKNESYFLKKWIQYYSQFFDLQDMLVLNNNSDDGCTNNIHIRTQLLFGNTGLNCAWVTQHVRLQFETLLHDYKYVLYVDVDEFIVPTHNPNLRSYIEQQINNGSNCLISTGWNIIHYPEKGETTFDFTKNILSQRQYANDCISYNKPYCANYTLDFIPGQHSATNEQWHSQHQRNDTNALLLHAKLFDMQYTVQRYQKQLRQFNQFEPDAPITDHAYIFNNQPQQFLDYHFPQRFNGSVHHLSQLIHYDYTHLF